MNAEIKDEILYLEPYRLVWPDSWVGHIPFAFLITKLVSPKLIVELGTHTGNSACAFAQAMSHLKLDSEIHAIDSWEGDEHAGSYGQEIYHELKQFSEEHLNGRLILKKSLFKNSIKDYGDETIDILHIDGLHTYEAVQEDYISWLPKLAPEGIVLFHDICVTKNSFGVKKFWEELSSKHPHFSFTHSHGLGVLFPKGVSSSILTSIIENSPPSCLVEKIIRREAYLKLQLQLSFQLQAKERGAKIIKINNETLQDTKIILRNQQKSIGYKLRGLFKKR